MIKAQLIDVGRHKVNKTIEVKDTKSLHREIGKHLLSKGWGLELLGDDDTTYSVTSGWNVVGTVKILKES